MLSNLQRKYNNNKRGARLKGSADAAPSRKPWPAKNGRRVSAGTGAAAGQPLDVAALRALALRVRPITTTRSNCAYLKNALDVNPKDVEVNRHCAESLMRMGQFDQPLPAGTDRGTGPRQRGGAEEDLRIDLGQDLGIPVWRPPPTRSPARCHQRGRSGRQAGPPAPARCRSGRVLAPDGGRTGTSAAERPR